MTATEILKRMRELDHQIAADALFNAGACGYSLREERDQLEAQFMPEVIMEVARQIGEQLQQLWVQPS
jgi:hypothetical protein